MATVSFDGFAIFPILKNWFTNKRYLFTAEKNEAEEFRMAEGWTPSRCSGTFGRGEESCESLNRTDVLSEIYSSGARLAEFPDRFGGKLNNAIHQQAAKGIVHGSQSCRAQ
jgi:hypothetical protein